MSKDRKSPLSRALLPAIVVHIVVVVLLLISFSTQHAMTPSLGNSPEPVKAKVIDGQAIEKEKQRREDEKQRKLQEEKERKLAEEKRKLEEAKKQEEQRLAEIQRKKEEEQRIAEEKKREQERLAEEKRKQEEAKRIAEEKKRKQEEAKRLAEEKRKQEEAKRRAQEEAEQKRIEDALRAEEEELAAAERRAQAAARKRELSRLSDQYKGAIMSKVQRNWRTPVGNYAGASCKVFMEQAPGGYITNVRVQNCTGGDESLRRSVEEAVLKSEPLPAPPKEELFERQIQFTFRP